MKESGGSLHALRTGMRGDKDRDEGYPADVLRSQLSPSPVVKLSLENLCDPIGLDSTLGLTLTIYKTCIKCFQ